MGRAMLTLLSMSLGQVWGEVVLPIWDFQPHLVSIFVIFVFITTLGVLNVVIGVICEQTSEAARKDREGDLERIREEQIEQAERFVKIITDLDDDSDGHISQTELCSADNEEVMKTMMGGLNLPKGFTPTDFFMMLDENCNGVLTSKEFLRGMFRLIENNDYQRACVTRLQFNQLKKQVRTLTDDSAEMKGELREIKTLLATIAKYTLPPDGPLPGEHDASDQAWGAMPPLSVANAVNGLKVPPLRLPPPDAYAS
eukprot:gnl/TRDRNA2_/TRDRNA2_94226_c0_seq1.p1 gnl/TRDRNA2_/TRDRNA2_94226_c0~~gnl/TRDRNA2_/TRDRNA2_94226_c0_seq1.p1  ORF type:complete len:281 (+),score=56.68 gnl/TRDRNA2_/TRDRNA2_94226_c0_seq1:80-844(+)